MSWSETFLQVLKDNDVRLVTYVPDNVLTPLIRGIHADNYFMPANATREDEAMGIVAGDWMAGMKGAVLMQTSGFAVAPNALASLIVPYIRFRRSWLFRSAAPWASSTSGRPWWRACCGPRSKRWGSCITLLPWLGTSPAGFPTLAFTQAE